MFSRRWLTNYALALLIAAVAYLGLHSDDPDTIEPAQKLLALDASQVSRLEILTSTSRFVLNREQHSWTLEQPVQWPANRLNVDHFLRITEAERESGFPAAGKDLQEFGLQQPYARLILNETEIAFGISHSIGERRYALIDETIILLPDIYFPFIQQGIAALIDRRLLPPSLELQSLNLADLSIQQEAGLGWQATGDQSVSADWADRRITNWQGLEASRVTSLKVATEAKLSIEARLDNGEVLNFGVISTTPEIVITNPAIGLNFHFPEDLYQQLLSPPDETAS